MWLPARGMDRLLAADKGEQWLRWDYLRTNQHRIFYAVNQHVQLTVIAVVVGLLISFPLAVLAYRYRRLATAILGFEGALYTIPSIALFGALVPLFGLTYTTAEIGLVSYTLLILTRNVLAGLDAVPEEVREAATGMGIGRTRMLLTVELPLALPAVFAGIRLATVTTVGLVTVTALIAQPSLGQLITDGIGNFDRTPIVVGTVLSILLAGIAYALLQGIERLFSPWTRRARAR